MKRTIEVTVTREDVLALELLKSLEKEVEITYWLGILARMDIPADTVYEAIRINENIFQYRIVYESYKISI